MIQFLKQGNFFEQEWDEFIYNFSEGTLFHTIAWRNVVKETFGFQDYYLMLFIKDKIKAVLPLFLRRNLGGGKSLISIACGNYGGICGGNPKEKKDILNRAIQLCNNLKCNYIELRDHYASIGNYIKRDYCTTLVSLKELNINGSFGKSVAKNIKRAQKAKIKFKMGKKECLNDFLYIYRKNMKDLGSFSWPELFFQNIIKYFAKNFNIAVAIKNKEVIAGDFLIRYKGKLHSLFAGSDKKYNSLGTNYYIIWNSMLWAKKHGCHTYDFGRSITGSGTFQFKQHWHGENINLKYSYYLRNKSKIPDLNPEKGIYLFLRNIWKKIPNRITQPIGERIIKYIH